MPFSISGLLSLWPISASRDDMEKACINLFITYFNIELKRTKLISHTNTKLIWIWVINIGWGMITVLLWKKSCIDLFIERLDIVLSDFCPDICPWADIAVALRCLRMGKIDVITYKYVINTYLFVGICISCNMDWIIWRLVYCTIFVRDTQDRLAGSIIVFSSVIVT